MSDEREVTRVGSGGTSTDVVLPEEKSDEAMIDLNQDLDEDVIEGLDEEAKELYFKLKRVRRKARVAEVLERGLVADRLYVELPDDVHGEWVLNDPVDIDHAKLLGFELDTEYATNRALHSAGDGKAVIGDVIHMITSQENKDLIDEVKREKFIRRHGKPGQEETTGQAEETEFAAQAQAQLGIPVVDKSTARTAREDDIREALAEQAGRR